MSRGIVLGMLRPETRAITVDHATGATNAKRCPAASQEEYGKEAAPSPHEARSSLYVLGRRASGWGSELWSAEPLHSLQARISDSSARFFDNSCERGPTTVWPAALDPLFLSGSYSSLFYNAVHVYIHPYDDGGYAPPLLHRGGHSWLRCPHHVHARARTLSRHSCIDPACSPSTPSLPTPHHHHPPAALPITSQFFTVHNRRQSMSRGGKLAPEVNRALFVKNLSFNVTPEELFDLFGKFGPVRQIRQGIANHSKGTAFVVYEDVMDAKSACDKLNGFNFQNRYLVVLYHQPDKMLKAANDLAERQENLEKLKKQHGID